jgi:protein phosphatase
MNIPEMMPVTGYPAFFCAADGIGGAAHGEIASMTVLRFFSRYSPVPTNQDEIVSMVTKARGVLDRIVRENPAYTGFGTTIAGLILTKNQALAFNCGDSRVYLIDAIRIERLSHDHSLVQELTDHGEITDEQRYTHPLRNIITSSVSGDPYRPQPHVFTRVLPCTGAERFLLCTDGVWEMIRDPELHALCSKSSLEQAAGDILATCLARGGPDNISLILVGQP